VPSARRKRNGETATASRTAGTGTGTLLFIQRFPPGLQKPVGVPQA
jgi:hypothetical protein